MSVWMRLCAIAGLLRICHSVDCSSHSNCGDCLQATGWFGTHKCSWCRIENSCYHVFSAWSICSNAPSNACITLSSWQNCDFTSIGHCPAPGEHKSPNASCDAKGGPQQKSMIVVPTMKKEQRPEDNLKHSQTSNSSFAIPRQAMLTPSNKSHRSKGQSEYTWGELDALTNARAEIAATGVTEDHTGEAPLQDLAQMSADVYQLYIKGKILNKPPAGWTIDHQDRDSSVLDGTLKASTAVYTKWPLAVLVFKGTSGLNPNDDIQDIVNIALGQPPISSMIKAAELIAKYQSQGYTVMTTGHSLGGYLAEIMATTIGLAGAGFCAIGPGWHDGFKGGHTSGFRNVNFRVDPLGNYAPLPGYGHAQIPIYVEDCGVLAHHHYKIMLRAMRARGKNWTNQNAHCLTDSLKSDGYSTYVPGVSCIINVFNPDAPVLSLDAGMPQTLHTRRASFASSAAALAILVGVFAFGFIRYTRRHLMRPCSRIHAESSVRLLTDA